MMGCLAYAVLLPSIVTPVDCACGWMIIRETFCMTMCILRFPSSGTVQFAILHRPPLVRNEATCHRPYILVLRFSQKLQIS
ncbi:hypothetical protein P692DRAFT_20845815 [Suillus brevipes Sb2]|nr:hypothetical protein P692DRAFT_20845815 [Suillus brevipes Sb2]